jgi:hypothetical protein
MYYLSFTTRPYNSERLTTGRSP